MRTHSRICNETILLQIKGRKSSVNTRTERYRFFFLVACNQYPWFVVFEWVGFAVNYTIKCIHHHHHNHCSSSRSLRPVCMGRTMWMLMTHIAYRISFFPAGVRAAYTISVSGLYVNFGRCWYFISCNSIATEIRRKALALLWWDGNIATTHIMCSHPPH